MKKVFSIPPPILVPDGTELHEIIGPRALGELGKGMRVNDGVSLALGKLPTGIKSKVHVHPVVWHFAWVRRGILTVKMKDESCEDPYRLEVPEQHGVLTEPGTFFQLLNETDELCEVFYIVGPGFVFEASEGAVRYNDAVVFDQSWDELKDLNWRPPGLPSHLEISLMRQNSLMRTAEEGTLHTVHHVRWPLLNGPGSVAVPTGLHLELTKNFDTSLATPLDPDRMGTPSSAAITMVDRLMNYLQEKVGLQLGASFLQSDLPRFVRLKCEQRPAVFAEYELAAKLVSRTDAYIPDDEVWHLLIFGQHSVLDGDPLLPQAAALARVRYHVFNELFDFAVTIGGGFKATGAMENYRAYQGGTYLNPASYHHYVDRFNGGDDR